MSIKSEEEILKVFKELVAEGHVHNTPFTTLQPDCGEYPVRLLSMPAFIICFVALTLHLTTLSTVRDTHLPRNSEQARHNTYKPGPRV